MLSRPSGVPIGSAEACFKDFDSAVKYAQGLPGKAGKKVRIFAVLFDKLHIEKSKWDQIRGEIPNFKQVVDMGPGYDFLTLHQPAKGESSWFWESMNVAYGDPSTPPQVLHRPFDWVMPNNVTDKTGYNYVMFCVVYAKDSYLLPPVQNCGK